MTEALEVLQFIRSCDSTDQSRQQELSPGMASAGERREAGKYELGLPSQPCQLPGRG